MAAAAAAAEMSNLIAIACFLTTSGLLQALAPAAAEAPGSPQQSPFEALLNVARNMFPDNVAAAAVDMNILGVISFSLFFGLCLSTIGDIAEPLIKIVDVSMPSLHLTQWLYLMSIMTRAWL